MQAALGPRYSILSPSSGAMTVPLRDVLEEALTSVSQHARSKLQDNELVATWSTGVDPLPNLLGHYGWLIAMMGLVLVLLIQWSRTLQRLEMTMARAVHAMQEAVQKLEENKSGGTSSYRPEQSDQGMEELWCDIRAYTKTVQHLMDMVAYQDRQLSDQAGQQEDVARGHVELTKAVNNLLAEVSVRMPRTATATSILDVVKVVKDMMTKMADSVPKDWHTDIAQAIDDLKAKLDTLPAQQTGDQTVSSGEGPSATHSKVRETLARVELLDKNLEKVHGKLAAVATVLEKIDPTRSLNEVGKPIWERLEQLTRSKLQSLAEEVNLVRGQHSSQHKDEVGLLKGLERTLAQLQSIMDGLSVRMAQIGASFSQAPVDSAGQTRALELLGQLGELCKETAVGLKDQEGAMQEFREATQEHVQKTQELGAVVFELRDRMFSTHQGFRTFQGGPGPSRPTPTVIDLQSRIARPAYATVTYPDGRVSMIPEEQLHHNH